MEPKSIPQFEARQNARLKRCENEAERLCVRPAEAERLLGVSHFTLYRLLQRGEIESFTIGRARKIPLAAIKSFIAARLEKHPKRKAGRPS
jgi:excisionase family DNA binding protein